MLSFIHDDIHVWEGNGCVLVSDEATKRLTSHPSVDDAVNWLFLSGFKPAARALNATKGKPHV